MDRSVRVALSAEVGAFVSAMGRAADATSKVAKAGADMGAKHQKSVDNMARGATRAGAAITGGLGAGIVGLVKKAADFDAQMSNVAASTGATEAQLGRLRKAALDAGQEFGQFTATDAAGALEELGKAGLSTGASIKSLRGVMGLAAADNMEVGRAAEITAQALTAFSREGVTATQVANGLAQGAGAAVGSASELGQGLSNVAPLAASMGIKFRDTAQTLAIFAQNGIRGAEGGTMLKSMLLAVQNPSKEATKQMKALGVAAYDTKGKFVGMRSIFDQLNKKTKDLTQEQKDAALATIFGSHAVLGANVAMKEGVKGYDAMGKAMAGFGSAADMAAKRNDNLKGDLKDLGGAWENLSIKLGGSGTGPLRDATQSLTDLLQSVTQNSSGLEAGIAGIINGFTQVAGAAVKVVEAFGRLSPEMQSLIIKGTAAAGVGSLVGGGLLKGVSGAISFAKGISSATSALARLAGGKGAGSAASEASKLGASAGGIGKSTGAMSAFGAAAVVAGAAVAGIEIARVFNSANTAEIDKTRTSVEQLTGSMNAAKSGAVSYGSAVDNAFAGTGGVVDGVTGGLLEMQVALNNPKMTGLNDWTHGLVGMKTSTVAAREQVAKLDQTFATLDTASAAVSMQQVSNANAKVGLSTQQLISLFPTYTAKLRDQAAAMGVLDVSAKDMESWMGGRLPASVRRAAEAMVASKGANASMAAEMLKGADAAAKLSAQVNTMPTGKKLDLIVNAANGAKTVDQFTKSLKGLPPKVQTELRTIAETKGIDAAKKALKGVRDKQVTVGTKADLSGQKTAQKGVNATKGKTVTVGTKADVSGKNRAQAAVNSTKGKTVTVGTKADTSGQRTAQSAVNRTSGKTVTVSVGADTSGASRAQAAVNSVQGKTVYVTTIARTMSKPIAAATGGPIVGPGTGTSDSIPALLSNGEHVWTAAEVAAYGGQAAMLRLRRAVLAGKVQRFATGGPVRPGSTTYTDVARMVPLGSTEWAALVAAVSALTAATRANTSAQRAAAPALRAVAAAQKGVDAAKSARTALNTAQKQQDAAANQRTLNARKAVQAAQRTKSKADDAKAQARLTAATNAKRQLDINQSKAMAAATTRVGAAQKNLDRVQRDNAGTLAKAAAATKLLKDRQAALLEVQQRVRDSARQMSDAVSSSYGMGGDVADWIATLREGAGDLNRFQAQLVKLRQLGLDEANIQKIASAGPATGGAIAAELIAGGRKSVDKLDAAAAALQKAADTLGMTQAVGVARAGGGAVWGAGTSTSDSISARLSDGEFVLRTWAAQRIGYDRLEQWNRTGVAHMATGGRVHTGGPSTIRLDPTAIVQALAGMQWVMDGHAIDVRLTQRSRTSSLQSRLIGV